MFEGTKKVFTIRHAHKFKTFDKDAWRKTQRYKENALDTPLSKPGVENARRAGAELVRLHNKKLINLNDTKYFYASPLTRCATTALEIIKIIEKKLGIKLLLRLNSKLMEGVGVCKIIKFVGDKAVPIKPKYVVVDGKKFYSELDNKLSFANICKAYAGYIDKTYRHISDHGIELPEVSAVRIVKCVSGIMKKELKLALFCGHANINYNCYNYFLQLDNIDYVRGIFSDESNSTSMLVGYEFDPDEKNPKKRYKIIYKPNNNFNLKPHRSVSPLVR